MSNNQEARNLDVAADNHKPLSGWACFAIGALFLLVVVGGLYAVRTLGGAQRNVVNEYAAAVIQIVLRSGFGSHGCYDDPKSWISSG